MSAAQAEKARNRGVMTGILGGFVGRSASLLAPFIVMPAMLHYLGSHLFGTWMTAVAMTSMALFVDFGIGNGLLTFLSKANGQNDHTAMRSYIASAYATLSLVALVLLMLLAAGQWLLHLNLAMLSGFDLEMVNVYVVCLAIFVLGVPASIIQRVMYACQQAWLSNVWQIVGSVFSVVLCMWAIRAALPVWQVIAAYSLPPIVVLVVSTVFFFVQHSTLRPRIVDFSREHAQDLLRIGARFLLLSIVTSISLNADNVIIAHQLGAAAVTEYAVPAKLASLLGLVITTLFLPLWAANGEALARHDYAWVRRITLKMSLLGGCGILLAGGVLVGLGDYITKLWMGKVFEGQTGVLISLSILSFFMALTSPFNMILNSLGVVKPQIVAWLIFMIVSLPLKFFLLKSNSIWVVPLVSAVVYGLSITSFMMVYNFKNNFGAGANYANSTKN